MQPDEGWTCRSALFLPTRAFVLQKVRDRNKPFGTPQVAHDALHNPLAVILSHVSCSCWVNVINNNSPPSSSSYCTNTHARTAGGNTSGLLSLHKTSRSPLHWPRWLCFPPPDGTGRSPGRTALRTHEFAAETGDA